MKDIANLLIEILLSNWPIVGPIVYELIVRIWPTKWNLSILDAIWKFVGMIIPNKRQADGTEKEVSTNASGALVNKIKVKVGRHIVRVLIPLFLFLSIGANAQIWQNFKGIRLVNESDTSAQLQVQGSLFYDDVLDSLYLYNGTKWVNLTRQSSGGATVTASNGLTKVGDDIQLGGAITPFTTSTIDVSQSELIFHSDDGVGGGGSLKFQSAGSDNYLTWGLAPDGFTPSAFLYYSPTITETITDAGTLINKGFADGAYWKTSGTTTLESAATTVINIPTLSTLGFQTSTGTLEDESTFGVADSNFEGKINLVEAAGKGTAVSLIGVISGGLGDQLYIDPSNVFGFGAGTKFTSANNTGIEYTATGYVTQLHSLVDKEYADTKLDGTMAAGQIAFGADANTLQSDADYTYNAASNLQTVGNIQLSSGNTGNIRSGTYVPTLTNVTNITTSTLVPSTATYIQIGNIVTVHLAVNITTTSATTATELGITLPITTSVLTIMSGSGVTVGGPINVATAEADFLNDRAVLFFTSTATAANEWHISFQYSII